MTYQGKRQQLARIIFETDTQTGRLYDIGLIAVVILSVTIAMLDSVTDFKLAHGGALSATEWCLTALFTFDYVVRLACASHPWRYARSFYGIIDFLSVVPTYLSMIVPDSGYLATLATIRFLRVLRVFRVLNLSTYQVELQRLRQALAASMRRILAFLFFVLTVVVVLGALMYTIEYNLTRQGTEFSSIPRSIYWAIVTLTTVGYGDISPQTNPGRAVAALIMILGYSIIVIPTGIIATTIPKALPPQEDRMCPQYKGQSNDADAVFCKYCGHRLDA
jgi:voltage-gated potassium channel